MASGSRYTFQQFLITTTIFDIVIGNNVVEKVFIQLLSESQIYILKIRICYEADTFKSIKNSAVSVVVSRLRATAVCHRLTKTFSSLLKYSRVEVLINSKVKKSPTMEFHLCNE